MKKFIGDVKYVFLPGVPGRKKDFQFIKDLRGHGLSVIEYRHPGLYNEDGCFSVVKTVNKITSLLKSFEKSRTPFVIVAYSFSSLIVQKINIKKFNYLRGIIMFSPICGLGKDWVMEDFNEDLKRLIDTGECRSCNNLSLEIDKLKKPVYGFDAFKKLTDSGVPISLCFSENDTVINIEKLKKSVTEFRDLFGQGALLAIKVSGGDHRIDSYYNECIRNLLLSFVAREKVHNLIGNNCQVFLWGSTQIANFFKSDYSDIDLYVISNNYIKYFSELSNLQLSFEKIFEVKLDISINNSSDLLSEKISRFNRGPLIAHGVNQLFFNLERNKIKIDIDFKDVKYDCYRATLGIYRECEKQIARINGSYEQLRWFFKLFTVATFYLLHVRDNINVDMNNMERWLDDKKDKDIIKLLVLSARILRGEKNTARQQEWSRGLKVIKNMINEEEASLNIEYKTYPLIKVRKKTMVTRGKSLVVILKKTKKVFKTYFIDQHQKIRDVERVVQHAKQLKLMQKYDIPTIQKIDLIDDNSAILMDYIDGTPLNDFFRRKDVDFNFVFSRVVDAIANTHKSLNKISQDSNILICNDEFNYHCARNFQLMSLPNFLTLGETKSEKKLKNLAKMAARVISSHRSLLNKNEVIYGDFKPENVIWCSDNVYLIDPMLSLGKKSCDIGKMMSRLIMSNSGSIKMALPKFINAVQNKYGKKIVIESMVMAAFDMLNLASKMISTCQHYEKQEIIDKYTAKFNKLIPDLLTNKL
jgi:tRNA A-37 threonylcarbamoyl transferase component Bud32